ncbi:hypothetical protein BJF77_14195 [Kocuria sp. CNJ-770]|nr:hypothetical protein BJF77_14195 [Kocuria sp. CNJ-770]
MSFVAVSKLPNVERPPARRSATISAMVFAGATRPRHSPFQEATSPIAQTCSAEVRHASSITTPPRGAVSIPAL